MMLRTVPQKTNSQAKALTPNEMSSVGRPQIRLSVRIAYVLCGWRVNQILQLFQVLVAFEQTLSMDEARHSRHGQNNNAFSRMILGFVDILSKFYSGDIAHMIHPIERVLLTLGGISEAWSESLIDWSHHTMVGEAEALPIYTAVHLEALDAMQ